MLISELNISFDIVAVTLSWIKKDLSKPINLQLNNYSIEHTPNEMSPGGMLLSISKWLPNKLTNNFRLCDPEKMDHLILCSNSTNVIVSCIYKHPTLPISDFTSGFISPLLLGLQKEEFDIDLLEYKTSGFNKLFYWYS